MAPPSKHSDITRSERKAKKRKLVDAVPDLPGDVAIREDAVSFDDAATSKKRKRNEELSLENEGKDFLASEKVKKKKKVKKSTSDTAEKSLDSGRLDKNALAGDVLETTQARTEPKKSKKERKAERKTKELEAAVQALSAGDADTVNQLNGGISTDEVVNKTSKGPKQDDTKHKKNQQRGATSTKSVTKIKKEDKSRGESKDARFIVFIGNLPFSATSQDLQKHFSAVKPSSIRLLTKKEDPKKSRGCAFLEFDGYDHMKTCLKLFHHSNFNDGISPARKINVELTAGGGGKSQGRKAKITQKNEKLNEERGRRIREEAQAKAEKNGEDASAVAAADRSDVHPSRRGQVPSTT